MFAAHSTSGVTSPQSDGSEEPFPSKRTRRVFPSVLQVTRVMPGVSLFVLSQLPERSDGESEPGSAWKFSNWSRILKYFITVFPSILPLRVTDCSIGPLLVPHISGVFNPCHRV